ncbi:hypothetical protein JCM10450v2_008016 [Rhodotorula kratochvilovae]
MASGAFAASLAQLTGLDADTAREQLLPHLDSLSSVSAVRNYLDSLLAPGPAAQSFVAAYTAHRFPAAPSAAGGSSSWGASAAPSSAPGHSRAHSPAQGRASTLERALASAPHGARAYVKEREDAGGWGGGARTGAKGKSAASSREGSKARAAPPVAGGVQVRQVSAPARQREQEAPLQGKGGAKGKGKEQPQEPELELSEEAAAELLALDRALKAFDAREAEKKKRSCFCQARQHPLSPYIPLCPSCALVLCTLNSPALRCPSCAHFPLLSSAATASHIATLQSSREELLLREKRRATAAKEQDARERAAIRFPSLGMDMEGIRRAAEQQQRSYAGHAGGTGGLAERIERTFEARAAASAKEQRERAHAAAGGGGGRVLRLDGKTGKVKVQTKVVRPAAKGKAAVVAEETTGVLAPEEHDDGLVLFVDEDDNGVRGAPALRSRKGEELAALRRAGDERVFVNVTLDEAERPVWLAADEAVDGAEDENAPSVVGDGAEPSPSVVAPARSAVPGAPAPKEEVKGKRRRGNKGGKGKEGAEAA